MGDREKKIFLFFLFIFFGFCALFAVKKIADPDFWWHLKTGEWIWQHKAIPYVDPFSYTFKGAEWINYEWLFHAIIYPIYRLGGFEGLIIFVIICALLTFFILFLACREVDGGKRWLTITILFAALLVMRGRLDIRPQIISFVLLALYLYLLILYRDERITARQLILFLIPAHILWVNVHGSFLLGIFLVGAYALGRFVPLALEHHKDLKPVFHDKKLQGLLFVCLLLFVACLANPYTYRIFTIPLKTVGSETLQGIIEWSPVDIRFLGVLVIDYTMWFRVLFLLGAVSFLTWRDNLKKFEDVIIFAFFAYMAFKHIRFVVDFALVVSPIIVNNISHLQSRGKVWKWVRLFPLFVVIVFSFNQVRTAVKLERIGFGLWRDYPEETVGFLKEHHIKGRLFNSYGHGGYLIWHLYPDIPVFIDGRTPTIYDDDFFWLYNLADQNKEVWKKIVQQYGIEIILAEDVREMGYAYFFSWLDKDADWKLVAFDDVSNLYLKRGRKFDELIEQFGFQYLRPANISMDYAKDKKGDVQYLKALDRELEEGCRRFPDGFYPFYYLGVYHQIYGTREHLQEAERAFRRAVTNRPNFPRGHYELGFTLTKLGRYDEAIKALKRSLTFSRNLPPDVYYYLGHSLFQEGKRDEAIRILERYKEEAGLETRAEAYRLLGSAYLQRYKFQKALSCFKRVGYLERPTWDTLLNMGIAYFGLDRLEKARDCFERAREINPGTLKVVYNLAVVYEKLGHLEKAKRMYEEASHIRPQTPEEEILIQKAREKIE